MKSYVTEGTGSQQTLTDSQDNKIPVYDSRADVEADLANLTVGQIVATKDTGDELAQPVDVVESGNLHAVSSNAVYNETQKVNTISETNYEARRIGRICFLRIKYKPATNVSSPQTIAILPTGYKPLAIVQTLFLKNSNDSFAGQAVVETGGAIRLYLSNGGNFTANENYVSTITYFTD